MAEKLTLARIDGFADRPCQLIEGSFTLAD